MATEKEKAFVLDKSFPTQGEYVTFPGVPGRYLGGQAVPLSQLGVSLDEMRQMVRDSGAPLRESTGELLDDTALYGDTVRRMSSGSGENTRTREVGRYPGVGLEESDKLDAEAREREKRSVVREGGLTIERPEQTIVEDGGK